MKKMSAMAMVLGLLFTSGCGKISPTGPSEAVAAENSTASKNVTTATATPFLSFSPNQTTVRVGEEVTVEARVDNATDIWGVATTVQFDSNKLQFVKAEEGALIGVQNPTGFMSAVSGGNQNHLVVGLASLGRELPGVTGYGSLFRITFRALSAGSSEISFIETALFNSTNEGISKQKMNFTSRSATIVIE